VRGNRSLGPTCRDGFLEGRRQPSSDPPLPGACRSGACGRAHGTYLESARGETRRRESADEVERRLAGANLLRRVITADEIAYLVVLLASSK
jgi:hypothetical protein